MQLSHNSTIAMKTSASSGYQMVLGTNPLNGGVHYWEFEVIHPNVQHFS
jgi:hypothetical protein